MLSAWDVLLERLCDKWNVFGADVFNEPWGAEWVAPSDAGRDWRRMAEELGNAVLRRCPRLVVFVEGVGNTPGSGQKGFFWGENLAAAMQVLIPLPHTHR